MTGEGIESVVADTHHDTQAPGEAVNEAVKSIAAKYELWPT